MPVSSPRATARSFRIPPDSFHGDFEQPLQDASPDPVAREPLRRLIWQIVEWQRQTTEALRGVLQGKLNNTGDVTLVDNVATTTLSDVRIGADTAVVLVPLTANASAEVGAGAFYQTLPNATTGQAVLNHANNAQTDRDFRFSLMG